MLDRKRLLVADDHELILNGVVKLLEPKYDIVGQVANGRELVTQARQLRPDAVIVDIAMPELNGIEATRQLLEHDPNLRIVILTQQLEQSFAKFAFAAGAHGFVAKQASSSELLKALELAFRGHYFVTSSIVGKHEEILARRDSRMNPAALFGGQLSSRQREVLQLIAEGKSAKEIGVSLGISTKTAEFHRGAIMDELGLRTTAELTRYALSVGIVSL